MNNHFLARLDSVDQAVGQGMDLSPSQFCVAVLPALTQPLTQQRGLLTIPYSDSDEDGLGVTTAEA